MTDEKLLAPFKAIYDRYVHVANGMDIPITDAIKMKKEIDDNFLKRTLASDETPEEKIFWLEGWASAFFEWQVATIMHHAMEKRDD